MDFAILSSFDIAMIPVTVGIVSEFKTMEVLPPRFAPLAAILAGTCLSFAVPAATTGLTVLAGVVIGLAASGLYSGTKATVQG